MSVELKPTTADDYEEYYKIRCDHGDVYWNGYESAPDKETFRNIFLNRLGNTMLINPGDRRIYLIQNKGENVGFLQLIKREDGIDIGYTVDERNHRKGYATSALEKGVGLAQKIDDRVYVQIRDDNVASQGVALKCGFTRTDEYTEVDYPNAGVVKLRKFRFINQNVINDSFV